MFELLMTPDTAPWAFYNGSFPRVPFLRSLNAWCEALTNAMDWMSLCGNRYYASNLAHWILDHMNPYNLPDANLPTYAARVWRRRGPN